VKKTVNATQRRKIFTIEFGFWGWCCGNKRRQKGDPNRHFSFAQSKWLRTLAIVFGTAIDGKDAGAGNVGSVTNRASTAYLCMMGVGIR
jgi:hypothetical protein